MNPIWRAVGRIVTAVHLVTAAMLLLLGCSEHAPTAQRHQPSDASTFLIVSSPVMPSSVSPSPATGVAQDLSSTTPAGQGTVYVSLPPGAIPGGDTATVQNLSTRRIVTVRMVDGGFDPVSVPATVGDTLQVTVYSHATVIAVEFARVNLRRPPVLVRTDPPKGKTDVPLNTQIVIVFSEPVDSTTLGGVRLFNGSAVVPGTVTLSDSGVTATFAPDGPLAPQAVYELLVDTSVRNLRGDGLAMAVRVPFTTGIATKLAFIVQPTSMSAGIQQSPSIVVAVEDLSGHVVTGASISISLTIGANPVGGTLSGTITRVAVNGVALFDDVAIDRPGSGYTLIAIGSGMSSAATLSFNVGITFANLTTGMRHSCGVIISGAAYCWGDNVDGELGNGTTTNSAVPIPVSGGLKFAMLSAAGNTGGGFARTCGVTTDGAAYCWGFDAVGQLGSGADIGTQLCEGQTISCSTIPVAVAGGVTFAIVAAAPEYTCGLTKAGAAYCWGAGGNGVLGDGTTNSSLTPVAVSGGLTFSEITVSKGGAHACGLTAARAAYCWGYNVSGQLGNGTDTGPEVCSANPCSTTPVAVSGGLTFADVSAGTSFTCGVTTAGAGYCWGEGKDGELGNASLGGGSTTPVAVSGGLTFARLSAGGLVACGSTSTGSVYCWGTGWLGWLGPVTNFAGNAVSSTPVPVIGGYRFTEVHVGGAHTCGLTGSGTAFCWGDDTYGALGNGNFIGSPIPLQVGP